MPHRAHDLEKHEVRLPRGVQVTSGGWTQGYDIIAESNVRAMEAVIDNHLIPLRIAGVIRGRATISCGSESMPFDADVAA